MSLSKQLIECVDATKSFINDYDHRSAIGMARSWVDNQKPIEWNQNQIELPNRDQLAKDLVAILAASGKDRETQIEALQDVRRHVNAPFIDPAMLGFQAGRQRLAKPGEKKKAAQAAAKQD